MYQYLHNEVSCNSDRTFHLKHNRGGFISRLVFHQNLDLTFTDIFSSSKHLNTIYGSDFYFYFQK